MTYPKYCSDCGNPVITGDKFCENCGNKINCVINGENVKNNGNNPPMIEREISVKASFVKEKNLQKNNGYFENIRRHAVDAMINILDQRNTMDKQTKIIILILLTMGVLFYWYGLRPSSIKKDCYKQADWRSGFSDKEYTRCLKKYGL